MADKIEIEILEDGTFKISTDKVSMANHTNAEGLLREISTVAGGETKRVKKANAVVHEHDGIKHRHEG
jgi:hypothetical protein